MKVSWTLTLWSIRSTEREMCSMESHVQHHHVIGLQASVCRDGYLQYSTILRGGVEHSSEFNN